MKTLNDRAGDLLVRIQNRTARVGVIGLGYVGLPFAVEQAKAGFSVTGVELDASRVAQIREARNYVQDISDEDLRRVVNERKLVATTDYGRLGGLDIVVITVPSPLTRNLTPDLSFIESAVRKIARHLRVGHLICLESTTFPGTTDEIIRPILEATGLKADEDFYLAHSPERVDPGNKHFSNCRIPKIVGAVGPRSHQVAMAFYAQTHPTVPVSSAKAAEMAKIFENTFRAVNIALVNEFAVLCDGMELNVWEILDAAFTKPFGIMPFYPGPGVGGHCIPLDPHYLEWKARETASETHFISLAGEINRKMPAFVREKILRCLNGLGLAPSRANVLLLGVAYKRDVDDYRESPALAIIRLIMRDGTSVRFYDPHVPEIDENGLRLRGEPELTESLLASQDLVVILTDHSEVDYEKVAAAARLILDTRNATKQVTKNRDRIVLL